MKKLTEDRLVQEMERLLWTCVFPGCVIKFSDDNGVFFSSLIISRGPTHQLEPCCIAYLDPNRVQQFHVLTQKDFIAAKIGSPRFWKIVSFYNDKDILLGAFKVKRLKRSF